MKQEQQILFSGIQPSGVIHLGNYFGAIKQWIGLQKKYEGFFCIVDLHAITVRQDPKQLKENIRRTAATYLACGVDPKKSVIFVQSHIPAHAELTWILNTFTYMGELERMTQYKDKATQHQDNINTGLFNYPVLMAADILLYQTNVVPVGDDQKQHVELSRDIAQRINNAYNKKIFTLPKPIFPTKGSRIMGLDNPRKKMSKSAVSGANYISFFDSPEIIRQKIKRAVTDSGAEITAGEQKPALTNLLTIFSLLKNISLAELEKKYQGKGYAEFKQDLAECLTEWLTPIQEKMQKLLKTPKVLEDILATGACRANAVAQTTLKKIKKEVGLL